MANPIGALVSIVRRFCQGCLSIARIRITERGDGWEDWDCEDCGWHKEYRTT